MRDQAAGNYRPDRMHLELERRRDAEVAAAPAHRPIEIRMLVGRRTLHRAVSGHHFDRPHVVECHAVAGHQPAEATAERETADTGAADHTAGRGQAVQLRFTKELPPERAALNPRGPGSRIDVDPFHQRQVDDQAGVERAAPADVVATAANRDFEAQPPRELYGLGDVRGTAALRHEGRLLVDHAVVHATGFVEQRIGRLDQPAREGGGEVFDSGSDGSGHDDFSNHDPSTRRARSSRRGRRTRSGSTCISSSSVCLRPSRRRLGRDDGLGSARSWPR